MTKRSYSVLQKRLQKLESELSLAVSLPPQTLHDHHQIAQYIETRFEFLRKLLSAEIASHPKKPYLLHKISRRLTELETAFRQWDSSNHCSCSESFVNHDGDDSPPPLAEEFYEDFVEEKVHDMDHESWLNDGVEDASVQLGSPGFEEAKKLFEGLRDEKVVHGIEEVSGGVEREVKREERRGWVGKYGGVLAAGLLLGMALMGLAMVRFSGCFHHVKDNNSLLRPT